jgi:RNA polymerase sigma-70 factor (ECF subfamily)
VLDDLGSAETDRPGQGSGDERPDSLTAAEFESMTTELSRPLFATALRLTRNRDDAEDLVQEALFRGFRSLHTFRKGSRFRAWMFRILHNVFINRIRREQLAPAATDPTDLNPSDHDHPIPDLRSLGELPKVADRHFDERVKAAVDGLPESFRQPMVLFSLGGLSYQEIADTLEIPIGTVMSRLHRARKLLRSDLAEYARDRGLGAEGGRA